MKSGSNQRHSEKQAQLIRTATELFTRFGSGRVTIDEICRKAGVSKMTFYKYFRNKVDLVRTIRDQWVEEGFRKFDEIDASRGRNAGRPAPPAQIPACATNAPGSYLR